MNATEATTVQMITFNAGKANETTEVVKVLNRRGDKVLIAYVRGARINTVWVKASRIFDRS